MRGLYMFSCTLMANDTHVVALEMVKNGRIIIYLYSNSSPYDTGATSVVLAMNKGDRVWIRRHNGDRVLHGNYNIFSGFLISENI